MRVGRGGERGDGGPCPSCCGCDTDDDGTVSGDTAAAVVITRGLRRCGDTLPCASSAPLLPSRANSSLPPHSSSSLEGGVPHVPPGARVDGGALRRLRSPARAPRGRLCLRSCNVGDDPLPLPLPPRFMRWRRLPTLPPRRDDLPSNEAPPSDGSTAEEPPSTSPPPPCAPGQPTLLSRMLPPPPPVMTETRFSTSNADAAASAAAATAAAAVATSASAVARRRVYATPNTPARRVTCAAFNASSPAAGGTPASAAATSASRGASPRTHVAASMPAAEAAA